MNFVCGGLFAKETLPMCVITFMTQFTYDLNHTHTHTRHTHTCSVQSNHSELTSKTSTHLAISVMMWFDVGTRFSDKCHYGVA